ncbi:MAG: hypothetical protein R2813_08260, partial [Flavobacteriales bacterium]
MRGSIKLLYTLSFLVFASSPIIGQDANNLALDATVKDQDGGKLVGASVSLIQDGTLVNKVSTGKNGRFDLLLDFGHEYIIEVSKSGFVTKKMYVNTMKVPDDEQAWGYEYGGFTVDLFKQINGVDFEILNKPVAKIYYDPNVQNFDYDKAYTKEIKAQLDELIEEYKENIKREEEMAKQLEQDYALALKDAEIAMNDGDLLLAQENYLAASSIKPDEKLPKDKLVEIERKISENANKDDRYMAILADADQLFGTEQFSEAKAKYSEASQLKPSEQYPKTRMAECDKQGAALAAKLKAEEEKTAKDKAYNDELAKADNEFTQKNYQNAKTYYQNAIGLKPSEKYPKDQLAMIEVKIKEATELAAKDKQLAELTERYKSQIAKADAAFSSGNWVNAKSGYEAAKAIKDDETYPDAQLAIIEARITEEAGAKAEADRLKKLESDYRLLIATADKDFEKKNYEVSKSGYEKALGLKDESYPKQRIEEIDALLAEKLAAEQSKKAQEEVDAQYNALIASGDNAFKSQNYSSAKSDYEKALALKDELYPKSQLEKVAGLQADLERENEYKKFIDQADKEFAEAKYQVAKASYNQALSVKPNDKYANNRLAEIDQKLTALASEEERLAQQQELDEKYGSAITVADEAFRAENYSEAIESYQTAKALKPKEKYPQDQIEKSNQLALEKELLVQAAEKEKEIQARYDEKIKQADYELSSHELEKARETYNLAAGIKPDQDYPKKQLELITKLLAEKKAREAELAAEAEASKKEQEIHTQFLALIKDADAFMDQEDYLNAQRKYQAATALKADEEYPKTQLKEIDQLLKEKKFAADLEAKKRTEYNNALAEGNNAIHDKDWEKAKTAFRRASSVLPDEQLPKDKLKEVDDLEARHKQELIDAEFRQLLSDADGS